MADGKAERLPLSERRAAFVREYLIDLNGRQAALRAGYSPNGATTTASRLLSNANVQAEITKEQRKRIQRTEVTADRVVEELRRIAFADLRDVVYIEGGEVKVVDTAGLTDAQAASLAEIKQTKDGIGVKMHSKQQALDSLGRYLGLYNENLNVMHGFEGDVLPVTLVFDDGKGAEDATDDSGDDDDRAES